MSKYSVVSFKNPLDDKVFYIGYTQVTLPEFLDKTVFHAENYHAESEVGKNRELIIRQILAAGQRPVIFLEESCDTKGEVEKAKKDALTKYNLVTSKEKPEKVKHIGQRVQELEETVKINDEFLETLPNDMDRLELRILNLEDVFEQISKDLQEIKQALKL